MTAILDALARALLDLSSNVLGPVHPIFAPAARSIRDAAREAGRAVVRAQQADCDNGMRPAGSTTADPPLRVAARKRVCQGNDPCRRDAPCIHRFLAATQARK